MSRIIISARIVGPKGWGDNAQVLVKVEGDNAEEKLFNYFDDELSFNAEEFVGLTLEEGRALFHKKDVAYLRS